MLESELTLTDIPAVGETRAENLQQSGFTAISEIADATVTELADVATVSTPIARCIRQGAKELRGDDDTIQAQIASDCNADRQDVAEAFATIAYRSGSFATKQAALEELFCGTAENSILHLDEYPLYDLYMFYKEGYRDFTAVAEASLDELTELSYIDKQTAEAVRTTARDALSRKETDYPQEEPGEDERDHELICEGCGREFRYKTALKSHSYHCTKRENTTQTSGPGPSTGDGSPASSPVTKARARKLLRTSIGPDAEFRPQQWEAIDRIVNKKERLLLVQRTGWGKSTVYFIATRLLRDRGEGPTLIISPLLSLMRNQIQDARQDLDLHAITINSNNEDEWEEAKQAVVEGTCDLLLISPERLANQEFRNDVLDEMAQGFGMLVVDEAHCISDWGHDFRPDYRRIKRIIQRLPEKHPVAATTATANDRVVDDVTTQLPDLTPIRGTLVRESLKIQAIELGSRERRLAWLAENLTETPVAGIIYCLTTDEVETVADWLNDHGLTVLPYHGGLDGDVRRERENKLMANDVDALVATNALGMGFNKPDLGFVIHFQRPPNLIRYYQEIGRAGRNLDEAYAVLLSGDEDDDIAEYFIESAFPEPSEFEDVLSALEASAGPLYIRQVVKRVDISWQRTNKCLDILRVEGAIAREDEGYIRTANPWEYDYDRVEQVTEQRWRELEQIQTFVDTDECFTLFIDNKLDGDLEKPCGHCANCVGPFLPTTVQNEDLVDAAIDHYRTEGWNTIRPRARVHKQDGGYTHIDEDQRLEPGRVLSIWDDPGWGEQVRKGKYEHGRFDDALVEAAAELITEEWDPAPEPAWVTAVPSTSTEGVVADFAERLADHLGVPFETSIDKVEETNPQKEMENSYQKCWNVQGAFDAAGPVRDGPVLLVDDVVASRWTLTEVGKELRKAGSGPVYSFALAQRRGG